MALNYDIDWSKSTDDLSFDKLEIKCNDVSIAPVTIDLTTVDGDIIIVAAATPNLLLDISLLSVGGLKIKIKDIYDERYNSAKLFDDKWVSYINDGTITAEDLFVALKGNAKALYNLSRNETLFANANTAFLDDTNNSMNRSKFLALIGVRYALMKVAILLYISFTIAQNPLCDVSKSVKDTEVKKQEELNTLVQLLKDTTNLLVNIDAIPVMAVQGSSNLSGGRKASK